jgi:hypothetical protein
MAGELSTFVSLAAGAELHSTISKSHGQHLCFYSHLILA